MRYRYGNSLIEYALPLAVFFMAGLVLIMVSDLPDRLSRFITDTMNGTQDGGTINVQPLGTLASGQGYAIETTGGAGYEARVPGSGDSSDGYGSTETAGGLGDQQTGQGGRDNRLNRIADDLRDKNPELANLVTQLANLGHDAARLQKEMPNIALIGTANAEKIMDIYRQLKGAGGILEQFKAKLDAVMASNPDAATRAKIQAEADRIIAIIERIEVQYDLSDDLLLEPQPYDAYQDRLYAREERMGRGSGTVSTSGGDATGTETGSNNTCSQGGNQSSCNQDSDGDGQTSGGNQGQGQGQGQGGGGG